MKRMGFRKTVGRGRWLILIIFVGVYSYAAVTKSLSELRPQATSVTLAVQAPVSTLRWPSESAAVGIVGSSVLQTHGSTQPAPTASTAKLITALSVLQVKPLSVGEQGPILTLTASDVALYNNYAAEDGSVVPVTVDEQISEYQMLEAMLLPSANNAADSLAIWAFGSLPAYAQYANNYLSQLGLHDTHVGSDASGFDPSTTSTPGDLVRLGEIAMQNPVLAGIVGQSKVTSIPNTTVVQNVNSLLGQAGIIGVKTGNTNQAGGVFISASRVTVNGRQQTIVTAVMGAPTVSDALASSLSFITSAQANFQPVTVIARGGVVGDYKLPWGGRVAAAASQELTVESWGGSTVPATIKLESVSPDSRSGQLAGRVITAKSAFAGSQSVTATLQTSVPKPSFWWRLLHVL